MLKSTFINSKRSQACISSGDKTYLSGKLEEEKYFGFPEEKRQTVNMCILVTCWLKNLHPTYHNVVDINVTLTFAEMKDKNKAD